MTGLKWRMEAPGERHVRGHQPRGPESGAVFHGCRDSRGPTKHSSDIIAECCGLLTSHPSHSSILLKNRPGWRTPPPTTSRPSCTGPTRASPSPSSRFQCTRSPNKPHYNISADSTRHSSALPSAWRCTTIPTLNLVCFNHQPITPHSMSSCSLIGNTNPAHASCAALR